LLLADGEKVTIGKPTIAGAKVTATVTEEVKGKKLIVYKYKPKVRYNKKAGHRQLYTRLSVDNISGPEVKEEVK
jgi:large subunit ribosomal protein L21